MNLESLRTYCLSKNAATEDLPFDEHTLVFKVLNKIFAITSLDREHFTVNLKCDPERAITLREEFPAIRPGFHMNKKHWNTVWIDELLNDRFLIELIDHSYEIVVKGMRKSDRELLASMKEDA